MDYPTVSIYREARAGVYGGSDIAVIIKSKETLLPCESDIIEAAIISVLESRGQEVNASEGYIR